VVWRSSEAADLAGYLVYRRGPTGDLSQLTPQPIQATEYVDTAVAPGQSYTYRVTAIDQTGNESDPGGEVRATVQ
jgi:fibronectin type 3 domain-containing protein